jgi:hypothetical protein
MTNRIKMTLTGIGCGLLITAAGAAALLGQTTTNQAMTAAHPTPTATRILPGATITKTLPQATKTITAPPITITKTAPAPTYLQCPGHTEDSCYPDYVGKGRWILRQGERPAPKVKKVPQATTPVKHKVPGATIPGVCRHPSITGGMMKDCISLAQRPKVVKEGQYEIPAGKVLIKECTDQYTGAELGDCLKQ